MKKFYAEVLLWNIKVKEMIEDMKQLEIKLKDSEKKLKEQKDENARMIDIYNE